MGKTKEYIRIETALGQKVPPHGENGAPMFLSAPGGQYAKIIAQTAMLGIMSRMTWPGPRPTAGEKMVLPAGAISIRTLVFSIALWNGKDPILKERLFGLNPYEGNHGEDVKEYYYYLDATPTHSYMKFLYRYPQNAYPYQQLVDENQKRTTRDREFELIDTGIFSNQAFFDVVVEYAKADIEDVCIRIEIFNRGEKDAAISLLPQLWFRNRWSWSKKWANEPEIQEGPYSAQFHTLYADPKELPAPDWLSADYLFSPMYLVGVPADELLFTNNETHAERLYGHGVRSNTPYVKDAFHRYVIHKEKSVHPGKKGTKACFFYKEVEIPAKKSNKLIAPFLHFLPVHEPREFRMVCIQIQPADETFPQKIFQTVHFEF